VDLAEVVIDAVDLQPVAVRIDHLPPGQVVERRAPQHGLLATGIHGDVAADAGGEAEVGSTAKTRPASAAASETRSVTTPAPVRMVA
jgi:hypothetical protein